MRRPGLASSPSPPTAPGFPSLAAAPLESRSCHRVLPSSLPRGGVQVPLPLRFSPSCATRLSSAFRRLFPFSLSVSLSFETSEPSHHFLLLPKDSFRTTRTSAVGGDLIHPCFRLPRDPPLATSSSISVTSWKSRSCRGHCNRVCLEIVPLSCLMCCPTCSSCNSNLGARCLA